MGRRPSFDLWNRERIDLADGDVLMRVPIDTPLPVHVDAVRSEHGKERLKQVPGAVAAASDR